ncbi:MAG: YecA family protein [Legionella sp.]|nr:MAG: YecA family protein [Legionella sp.]
MSSENPSLRLPVYDEFFHSLAGLALPISVSELHGIMCGYLCANADNQGESYLRALLNNKKDEQTRIAATAMFAVYSISQQQIDNFDFEFELLLPDDETTLVSRAGAFSEWCQGFTQALTSAGISQDHFYDEESQEALQHIVEFGELDCDTLDVDEEDEKALVEVCEYTRLAVLRLHGDLVANERERGGSDTTH